MPAVEISNFGFIKFKHFGVPSWDLTADQAVAEEFSKTKAFCWDGKDGGLYDRKFFYIFFPNVAMSNGLL